MKTIIPMFHYDEPELCSTFGNSGQFGFRCMEWETVAHSLLDRQLVTSESLSNDTLFEGAKMQVLQESKKFREKT